MAGPDRWRWVEGSAGLAVFALAGCGIALLWPVLPPLFVRLVVLGGGLCCMLGLRAGYWRFAAAVLVFAGSTWLQAGWVLEQHWPSSHTGSAMRLQGTVVELPRHGLQATRFLLRLEHVEDAPQLRGRLVELHWRDRRGQSLDQQRAVVAAGQQWELEAVVRAPRSLSNPGGFDGARHALAARIHGVGWVEPGSARPITAGAGLDHWRGSMSARIAEALPVTQARFIQALTLGDTTALTVDDWQVLRSTGLTHLIAISGFHVTLLGMAAALLADRLWRCFPRLCWWLPRAQAQAGAALLGAGLYACAAGLGLPAVRTVLMVAVVCLARTCRRTTSLWQSLGWALIAVLMVDPLALLAAGFWLSFLGVAWLAWALGNTPMHQLKGLLAAQLVATIGLLPLTVFLFGQASLIGPLANLTAIPLWSLLVVPLCVVGLLLEAVCDGAGIWAWQLAGGLFAPSWAGFSWMTALPLAEWWLPESGLLAMALALVGAAWCLLPRALPGRGLAFLLWLPLLWPYLQRPAQGEVELTMLDVGQGLSLLVRTRSHALLYDTGPATPEGFDAGARIVVPALRALGVRRLDTLVISHGDLDHAGGAQAVTGELAVGQVHGPPGMEVAVPTTDRCQRQMHWQWDDVFFEYLHPHVHFPYLGNDSSCVLRITANQNSVLLVGDIGQVVEQQLVREEKSLLKAEVVQVAHHGSASSSSGAFIRATQAQLAVVSAGYDNRFGHPHPAVVRRWEGEGAEVLQTATSGAIRIWITKDGLSVRERRQWKRRFWRTER